MSDNGKKRVQRASKQPDAEKQAVQKAIQRAAAPQHAPTSGSGASANPVTAHAPIPIGQPGDSYEREAEQIADVVAGGMQAPSISALSGEMVQVDQAEKRKQVQMAQNGGNATPAPADEKKAVQKTTDPQADAKSPDQKKVIQKAAQPDEKAAVQRASTADEKKAVQKAAVPATEPKKETPAVQKAGAENVSAAPEPATVAAADHGAEAIAAKAVANREGGEQLPEGVRRTMEERFGADFSDVRIHRDERAQQAARALNARAFTYGHDIWLGHGESPTDIRLMAHELTHVLQQRGGVRRMIQRTNGSGGANTARAAARARGVASATDKPSIVITDLRLPMYKLNAAAGRADLFRAPGRTYFRAAGYSESSRSGADDAQQRQQWQQITNTGTAQIRSKLEAMGLEANHTYVLADKNSTSATLTIGDVVMLSNTLLFPFWDREGQRITAPSIDHVVDLQIAGWPIQQWANEAENLNLIPRSLNTEAGGHVRAQVTAAIGRFTGGSNPQVFAPGSTTGTTIPAPQRTEAHIKQNFDVIFNFNTDLSTHMLSGVMPATQVPYWRTSEIMQGRHIDVLNDRTPSQRNVLIADLQSPGRSSRVFSPVSDLMSTQHHATVQSYIETLIGSPEKLTLWRRTGSRTQVRFPAAQFPLTNARPTKTDTGDGLSRQVNMPGFKVESIEFDRSGTGTNAAILSGLLFRPSRPYLFQPLQPTTPRSGAMSWPLRRIPGQQTWAGMISADEVRSQIEAAAGSFSVPGASPFRLDVVDVDGENGLVARGKLLPTIPLIQRADIDLVINGDEVRIEKRFGLGDLDVPRPLSVTNLTLALFISNTRGFGVEGRADFGIERVGTGYLQATASTGGGFELAGRFNFDSRLFTRAEIEMWYRNNQVGGRGTLAIGPGKVRGIRSAEVTVAYNEGRLEATGNAELSIPGIQRASMTLTYDEREGLMIGGRAELANNIPGIRSGSIEAQVRKRPDREEYNVTARGTAVPAIPGISTTINVAYEDGIITIEGTAAYQRGMLSGSLIIGATNRPVDPAGNPATGTPAPAPTLRAYGNGTLTMRLTPWLQGTIGVRILPNGELEVSGELAVPNNLEVFAMRRIERNLFRINLDIPILGFAVAGQRVGIFATIGGGLDAYAQIGPGQLRNTRVGITYNPSHEENTRVTGSAEFYVPASAGLRLNVNAGIGAGLAIVSAVGGLEVGATMAIEAFARAAVNVEWTPTTGFRLDAFAELMAEPKFKFDVTGFVRVEANLVLTTIELYNRRFTLAQFEYGSNLRLGARFPVHYQEGQPFNVSLSDIQWTIPDIDAGALLRGLVARVVE